MKCPPLEVLATLVALLWSAFASGTGPEGRWGTFDDRTGAPRAVVRISIRDGRLAGVIERLHVRAGEEPEPLCTRCKGHLHDKPVLGLEILRGRRRDGERWVGGSILDPENGKEYRSTVWREGPDRLRVRGHWGPFYRTQTWRRPEDGGEDLPDREDGAPEGRP